MRTTVVVVLLSLGSVFGLTMTAAPDVVAAAVGEPAPAFELMDSTGKKRSLEDFAGKVVVIEWTNPECPFVKKHYGSGNMPRQQRAAARDDVVWLSINSSGPGNQGYVDPAGAEHARLKAGGAQTAYLLDPAGAVGRAYGAKATPHVYVVDEKGVLRYAGAVDSIASSDPADIAKATQYVPQALAELRSGKRLSIPVSRPYGCSVKYAN